MGRRVAKKLDDNGVIEWIVFACSGGQVIAEYESNDPSTINTTNPTRKYLYGEYIDEPYAMIIPDGDGPGDDSIYFYHHDHLYSIKAMTDESGAVVERYAYDAHGVVRNPSGIGIRQALPWDGFRGGARELVVPDSSTQIVIDAVTMPDTPMPCKLTPTDPLPLSE